MSGIANVDQYDAWNGDSGRRRVADPDHRDRAIAEVAVALLDVAHPASGEDVLDIGCGCGATTLAAADLVGPNGAAFGVDLSAPMLDVARERADVSGTTNVTFKQADAQTFAFEVAAIDVVISRFGTMFFADPTAAFNNIATALRSEGRLCVATWQPLAANEWLTIPGATLLSYGTMPTAAGGPGMFAQAEPVVIDATLRAANFDDVEITPVTVNLHLGDDPAHAASYLAESGPGRAVLETVLPDDRPRAIDAVTAVLAEHMTPTGVQLGGAIWLTTARRVD